jgi:hypothetical protein
MLGKVCEVDEEVTALRQTVLTSEREARALRVQKNKLDLLGASLKSQRLLRELLNPTTSSTQMSAEIQVPHLDELNCFRIKLLYLLWLTQLSAEIQKLLWATARLRSQLEFQGQADACLKVPHLDEYDSKKAGGGVCVGGEFGGGGGAMAIRLERSLLLDKLRGLEERVGLFEGLLACDDFFDATDIDRLVADYIMEGRCSMYRVEVRTGMAMDSTWDSEVYISLQVMCC